MASSCRSRQLTRISTLQPVLHGVREALQPHRPDPAPCTGMNGVERAAVCAHAVMGRNLSSNQAWDELQHINCP